VGTAHLASVFGGTSKDGGALRGKTGRLIRLLGLRPEYPELMHLSSQGARVEKLWTAWSTALAGPHKWWFS